MSPEDICELACSLQGRPDLEEKSLRILFPAALRQVHSLANFRRDRIFCFLVDPSIHQHRIKENLYLHNINLRMIEDINMFASYSVVNNEVIPADPIACMPYENADTAPRADYYGFTNPNTYAIIGDTLTINAVPTNVACVRIQGLAYPTYATDPITGLYKTNSWICESNPEILLAAMSLALSRLKQDTTAVSLATQEFSLASKTFLSANTQEIISWQLTL